MAGIHPYIGLFFSGNALGGCISKRRNTSRHSRADGSMEIRHIGCAPLATGRTGAAFPSWVPELPVLSLLGL